jgi:hypothetical protein
VLWDGTEDGVKVEDLSVIKQTSLSSPKGASREDVALLDNAAMT